MKRSRVCLAVAVLGCCFVAAAKTPPSSRPDASDTAHALFLKRMGEKGVELGLAASYYENASGLTKKSRTCASDLLKLGLAAVANPTLARIWAATNRTVSIGGHHARQERLVHGYTTLKGYPAFARRYPFLGGSGYACQDGDEITYEDALYSMMLPSSNTLAESVATGAGEFILKDFEKGSER